jgi:hypothetical protein
MPPQETTRNSSGRAAAFSSGTGVDLSAIGGPDASGNYADTSWDANKERITRVVKPVADLAYNSIVKPVSNIVWQGEAVRTNNPELSPYYNKETGNVEEANKRLMIDAGVTAFNIAGGQIIGGAARGLGRAASSRLSSFANITDPIIKFQGGTSVLPASTKRLNQSATAAMKTKATLAAGLTANPASAGAKAVAQEVATVPRSVVGRATREMGGHGTANASTRGAQFTIPNAAREGSLAEFRTSSAARAASRRSAAARAARADASDASLQITGSAAVSNNTASAVPDSTAPSAVNNAAATVTNKIAQPSAADRIAQTRAEDLAPVINNVKNPFENVKTSNTSSTKPTKTKPTAKQKPTKLKPAIGGGIEVGEQDVRLQRTA